MTKRCVRRDPVTQPQDESIRYIPLTQGQVAIVSAHRYEYLSQRNWHAKWNKYTQSFYAETNEEFQPGKYRTRKMHAIILGLGPKELGDHGNGNTLDNRDENLRRASHFQNNQNHRVRSDSKSGYSGVCWESKRGAWKAEIAHYGKRIFLGYHDKKEEAIQARKNAEKELHGEFARQ